MEALPISRKPHAKLRGAMHEKDASGKYIARRWGITEQAFSARMTGKTPWSIHEIYALMELLGLEPERMAEYFPDYRKDKKKGGRRELHVIRQKAARP